MDKACFCEINKFWTIPRNWHYMRQFGEIEVFQKTDPLFAYIISLNVRSTMLPGEDGVGPGNGRWFG